MKKLVWRLSEPPRAVELVELVNAGVISDKEARQILLSEVEEAE